MTASLQDYAGLSDADLANRVAARDQEAVRIVTGRNNQRLFRAAWCIVGNRADAEDVVQSTYLQAFKAIADFQGRSSLSTWLTRIAINEALGRRRAAERRRARLDGGSVVDLAEYREKLMQGSMHGGAPDAEAARAQVRALLEGAIAELPDEFRTVFVLRDIEGLSIDETADVLALPPATVKTRHFRARRRLQKALAPELKSALIGSFPFAGADCDALTKRILSAWCHAAE